MTATRRTTSEMSRADAAAETLASCLSKFEPGITFVATTWLERLRELVPGAKELVYDAYNALAIPFSASDRLGDAFVGLAIYPRHVNLTFPSGSDLDDPDHLLVGMGSTMRHLRVDAALLADRRVARLVHEAALQAGFRPVRRGKGEIVVKKIYARQRPRRSSLRR